MTKQAGGVFSRRRFIVGGAVGLIAEPVGSRAAPPIDRLEDAELVRTVELKARLYHVQGLDLDDAAFYVTSVDKDGRRGLLQKLSLDGVLLGETDVTDGARFHAGGISRIGEWLWVPVAEYRRHSSSRIERRSVRDLALAASFEVDDHIGAVAGDRQVVWGANWDAETLYRWSADGRLLARQASPTGVQYQDLKLDGGDLIASGEAPGLQFGAIDRLSPRLELKRRMTTGRAPSGLLWTHEGMARRGRELYFLPEDGDAATGRTHVYVFKLPAGRNV